MKDERLVIGCLEAVSFPSLGVKDAIAKIDTGAFSGALHCTNIKVVRRGKQKKRVLKFTPEDKYHLSQEVEVFQRTYIRSATGHRVRRYVIDTEIELKGKMFPIRIGLSDRSDMKRPVLIGRRFLRENGILVDVQINKEMDNEGENTL